MMSSTTGTYIRLPIPHKGLLHLALVGALGIALRRSHLFRDVTADRHRVPGHIGDVAAFAGHESAGEVVVYAGDFDNRSGKTLGRIIRIHFADAAFSSNLLGVREGDCHGIASEAYHSSQSNSDLSVVAC